MNIQVGKNTVLYVKKEDTFGTFNQPAATDAILLVEEGKVTQPKVIHIDEQKRNTASALAGIEGVYQKGTFEFTAYIKPVSAGVAPDVGPLLENLFGTEAIVAETSVTYTLESIGTDPDGLSMMFKKGNMTYFISGAIVTKGVFPLKAGPGDDSLGRATFSGEFCQAKKCGKTAVNHEGGYVAGDTAIVVDDATEIEAGTYVKLGSNDNSSAGYLVASSTAATNTIVIAALVGDAVADDAVVEAFLPTPTYSGSPVHGRYGSAQDNDSGSYANISIAEATVEITRNAAIDENHKGDGEYPTRAIPTTERTVTLDISKLIDSSAVMKFFYDYQELDTLGFKIPVGSTAGSRYRMELPYVEWSDLPELSGDNELTLNRKGRAIASSSYNDEVQLVFD